MSGLLKNIASKIICIILLQGLALNSFAHVVLDYPQGGETFQANTLVTIEWHIAVPHNQLNWDLLFSTDGGNTWEPLQLDLPVSQLSYVWVVPNIGTAFARISIIQDNSEQNYQDESMSFTIVPGSTAPFIDIAATDTVFQCDNFLFLNVNNWLDNHGGALAVGMCNNLTWTHDYTGLSSSCGPYTGNAFVTFTASDECGSTSTGAYLTVVDTIGPNLLAPASNLVLQCGPNNNTAINNWLTNRGGMLIFEVCSNVTWSNNYSGLSNDCGSTGGTTVVFSATDECGNITASSASITIEDHTAPTINTPAQNKSVSCTATNSQDLLQSWLETHGGANASDACGNLTWTDNYTTLNDGCGSTESATVTFTVTDDCGNSSTTSALFKIEDKTAPTILSTAQNKTISCSENNPQEILHNWLQSNGDAIATDSCGSVTWTNNFSSLSDGCGTSGNALITFTATDDCDNRSFTSANFAIVDTVAPKINLPASDVTIHCEDANALSDIQNWLTNNGGASASDSCGSVNWANDFSILSDTCSLTRIIPVNFIASDECNNHDTTKAILTILSTVGINDTHSDNFKISPNPVSDVLKIALDKTEPLPVQITIFDSWSRLVFSNQLDEAEIYIPVRSWPSGIYFLQVETDKGLYTRKVVVD
ncbi:MAG TPA: T9SS type A sorting domain-containing protein [Saprospiraceae bacterium]|nr:T9SS type A sorting domain-containing protein [Saprospiraceae bacterium]